MTTDKMKKKIFLGVSGFVLLLYGLSLVSGITTLVIPLSGYKAREHPVIRKGQIVNPMQQLDFGNGEWVAYLVINRADYEDLNPAIRKVSCFKSGDVELFKEMQKKWNCRYTGGDSATVASGIYFLRDGKIEFESGIVIDRDREGLQGEYGWLEPVEQRIMSDQLKHFKRVYWPVVVF